MAFKKCIDRDPCSVVYKSWEPFFSFFLFFTFFFPGVDLPYCSSNDLQCCSADYLEKVKEKVQQELNEGLRDEFDVVIDSRTN